MTDSGHKWKRLPIEEVTLPGEEWRVVPSKPQYQASSLGRIYSGISGMVLRPAPDRGGYLHVVIRSRTVPLHHLVMEAFVGRRPTGMHIRHLDGDQKNNQPSNLKYGTPSENAYDRARHGTDPELRKTHCPSGHPYDEENTWVRSSDGARNCRACARIRTAKRRAAMRSAAAA